MKRVKSLKESGILKSYYVERRKRKSEKRLWSFIFVMLIVRFIYMVKTKQVNILEYLPQISHIMNTEYGRRFIQAIINNQ